MVTKMVAAWSADYNLLYFIEDDKDGKGLKFEKTCQFFQNFKLCIEKSPKKLLWFAFPTKISLEFILLIL